MIDRCFVDTSGWFAFADKASPGFGAVRDVMQRPTNRLFTSNFVLDETITVVRRRRGYHDAVRIGNLLLSSPELNLIRVTAEDEQLAWQLFVNRSDQHYSFTDCTSFVIMRRLKIRTAIALDGDFAREGFTVMP